jgi:hypothetical protein
MNGFQAGNITAIRSELVVCAIRASDLRVKAFQIVFRRDGSLFVTFPYFRHRIGLLSVSAIPATGTRAVLVGRLPDGFSRLVDVSRLRVCAFSNEDFGIAVLEVEYVVILWVDDEMT